jgi:DNA-binding CsgD family transcriptional regulator/tetratricopeptide (TPR) repeat protein
VALLERGPFLEVLRSHLSDAEHGSGRLVLLGGEAGIGKTSLVDAFCREQAVRVRMLRGACDAYSTPRPLGALQDMASSLGDDLDQLIEAGAGPRAVFGGVLAQLASRGRTNLVVFEDVHWADEGTLDLLRFLARRLEPTRSLVIATYRDDEVGPRHPLTVLMGDIATSPCLRRMTLPRLSMHAVTSLAEGSGVDPGNLFRQTDGNPFFVTEVLAAGTAGIPPTVRDAVLARVARLSPRGRETLEATAVIGAHTELGLVERVAQTGDLEECLTSGVLTTEHGTLTYRHELARAAVEAAISPSRSRDLHRRTLELLTGQTGPADPARMAHHAEAAEDREAVLHWAVAAAERSARLGAHREAARQSGRALRFADALSASERAALNERLSHECSMTDQLGEAVAAGQKSLEIWRSLGNRVREGDILRRLSRLFWMSNRFGESEAVGREAVGVLQPLAPGPELAHAYSNLCQVLTLDDRYDEAIPWGERAIDLARSLGQEEIALHAISSVATARLLMGDENGRNLLEENVRSAQRAGLDMQAAQSLFNLARSAVGDRLHQLAARYLEEGLAYCAVRDLDFFRLYLLTWRAYSLLQQGLWNEAEQLAQEVRSHSLPTSAAIRGIGVATVLGMIRARRGEPGAMALLDEALSLAKPVPDFTWKLPVRAARAELAWLLGDTSRTRQEASAGLELALRRTASASYFRWQIGELAGWLWRAGGLQKEPTAAAEPYALEIAGRWTEAAEVWRALACPYEMALALAAGGEAALREAHGVLLRLGARPALAIVSRRLRELGVRDIPRGRRPATLAGPAGLTARELEVLGLLTQGLHNSEIAARLVISERTVANHVAAILGKLAVDSRGAAVAAATHLGLTKPN